MDLKKTKTFSILAIALLMVPSGTAADTNRQVGTMSCNATTGSGLTASILFDVVGEPFGRATLTAQGTALGAPCIFDIEVTAITWENPYYTAYQGFSPSGSISGISDQPCLAVPTSPAATDQCTASYEFDWTMDFLDPLGRKQTTHLHVDFDLVVNGSVVASGRYTIYEPSVPDVLSWI